MDRFYKPHYEKINTLDVYEEILKLLERYDDSDKINIIERIGKKLRQKNSIKINKQIRKKWHSA